MKKMTLKLMAVICLMGISSAVLMADSAGVGLQKMKVEKVVDGNVVAFEGRECKIVGTAVISSRLNVLELATKNRFSKRMAFFATEAGRDSQSFLSGLLGEGKEYGVEFLDGNSCVVYDEDGKSVGEKLVAAGYAVPALKELPTEVRDHYKEIMEDAQKRNAGLWVRKNKRVMKYLVSENVASL